MVVYFIGSVGDNDVARGWRGGEKKKERKPTHSTHSRTLRSTDGIIYIHVDFYTRVIRTDCM